MNERLSLCHYPTTIVFLDDNQLFLDSLSLELDEFLSYRRFNTATSAYNYIKKYHLDPASLLDFIDFSDSVVNGYGARLNLQCVSNKVTHGDRFKEPSVVVVDYTLRKTNGLDFCQSINFPNIKKVLLVDGESEQKAIAALNNNIIDCYIRKDQSDAFDNLNNAIKRLQMKFFRDMMRPVKVGLRKEFEFLTDPGFTEYFSDLCVHQNIIEYYFSPKPPGFLLVTAAGEVSNLIIYNDDDLNTHSDIALDLEAPADMVERITSKKWIPFFSESRDGYYRNGIKHWERCLLPADQVLGKHRKYFCAKMKARINLKQPLLAYDRFLKSVAA